MDGDRSLYLALRNGTTRARHGLREREGGGDGERGLKGGGSAAAGSRDGCVIPALGMAALRSSDMQHSSSRRTAARSPASAPATGWVKCIISQARLRPVGEDATHSYPFTLSLPLKHNDQTHAIAPPS